MPAGGEVRPLDVFHQFFDADFLTALPVVEDVHQRIHDFTQVVWRNTGRHPYRDARRPVDEQVGQARGQHGWLLQAAVEVIYPIDGVFFEVIEHLHRNGREARLGVTHRGRRVAIDGAEVALPIDQHVAHGKILRQACHRLVDGGVAVGVVFTEDFTDDAGGFLVRGARAHAHVVHRVQDAALYGLEAVARVGQCPGHDHAHRVIDVCRAHLVLNVDCLDNADLVFCAQQVYSSTGPALWDGHGCPTNPMQFTKTGLIHGIYDRRSGNVRVSRTLLYPKKGRERISHNQRPIHPFVKIWYTNKWHPHKGTFQLAVY